MSRITYPEPRVAIPTYGTNLIQNLPASLLQRPVVLTQPEPWALVEKLFDKSNLQLHMVETMEESVVQEVTRSFSQASAILGIGGGSALDHAKYVAWKTNIPLVLVPTILSVDAAYTKAIGVRQGARVRYVGEVFPEHLLVDFDIVRQAPPILNRSGVGDILSIFTALWDWREANRKNGEFYDPHIAEDSLKLLQRLLDAPEDIRDITPEGIRLLSDLYVGEVRLCEMVGNSRPEEGSEHYIAYCLESLTQRPYIHGQLIGLCVLLAGAYQGQDIAPISGFLKAVDLDCSPEALNVTIDELKQALAHMGTYVRNETQLLPGVFHFNEGLSEEKINELLNQVLGESG